jgi:hypothetical protein
VSVSVTQGKIEWARQQEQEYGKQESSAYRVKKEMAQRTRLQDKLAKEHCSA